MRWYQRVAMGLRRSPRCPERLLVNKIVLGEVSRLSIDLKATGIHNTLDGIKMHSSCGGPHVARATRRRRIALPETKLP